MTKIADLAVQFGKGAIKVTPAIEGVFIITSRQLFRFRSQKQTLIVFRCRHFARRIETMILRPACSAERGRCSCKGPRRTLRPKTRLRVDGEWVASTESSQSTSSDYLLLTSSDPSKRRKPTRRIFRPLATPSRTPFQSFTTLTTLSSTRSAKVSSQKSSRRVHNFLFPRPVIDFHTLFRLSTNHLELWWSLRWTNIEPIERECSKRFNSWRDSRTQIYSGEIKRH